MVNFAQHENDMKLVDEVDRNLLANDTNNKNLSGNDGKDKELLDEK